MTSQGTYTKNVGIRGIPGGGKTWCMMYISLYAISKGLVCITTAFQCKRALMLGGIHKHSYLCWIQMILPQSLGVQNWQYAAS